MTLTDDDRLVFQEGMEALWPVLAADPTALEAAVGGGEVEHVLVDGVGSGADATGDVEALVDVGGVHGAGQAVVAVVGDRHRVGLVVEGDHRHHWTEDLLPGDPHGVVDVDEHGRFDVPTPVLPGWPSAADDGLGTLLAP